MLLFKMMFWGLIVVDVLLVGVVLMLILSASRTSHLIPRIMAIVSGFAITGLAVFGGRSLTDTLVSSLLLVNPVSPSIWIFGVAFPALLGFGASLLLIRLGKKTEELTLRVVGFLMTCFIVYSLASVAMVADYLAENETVDTGTEVTEATPEGSIVEEFISDRRDGWRDREAKEALEALGRLDAKARQAEAQRAEGPEVEPPQANGGYHAALQSLAPNWSFLGAMFFYLAFFYRWPDRIELTTSNRLRRFLTRDRKKGRPLVDNRRPRRGVPPVEAYEAAEQQPAADGTEHHR